MSKPSGVTDKSPRMSIAEAKNEVTKNIAGRWGVEKVKKAFQKAAEVKNQNKA